MEEAVEVSGLFLCAGPMDPVVDRAGAGGSGGGVCRRWATGGEERDDREHGYRDGERP